jgi:LytS/YehU family sensor histidine kinase
LKKSDQTATAVEKLSSILDYVVYRCNDKFVPLNSELALIEDYVALEKIRYRKRLSVTIKADISENIKIAPLLLLTLLENACKHGTREELNEAKISISLTTPGDDIKFTITNTKPKSLSPPNPDQGNIGLANLEKQLALLYPNAHSFETVEAPDHFIATLRVEQR